MFVRWIMRLWVECFSCEAQRDRRPPWEILRNSYFTLSHVAFTGTCNGSRSSCKRYLDKHAWPYQVSRFKLKGKRLGPTFVRKGDGQHKARAVSLATIQEHLITMAGALRLPKERVKRHPHSSRPRPSDAVGRRTCQADMQAREEARGGARAGRDTRARTRGNYSFQYTAAQVDPGLYRHDDSFPSRCSSLSRVELEKARFPQVHEIHLGRGPQGDLMAAARCQGATRRHMDYKTLHLMLTLHYVSEGHPTLF